ncbi:MAG: hypothetical protein AAGD07_18525 [Planctomycetota bacterium]
MNSFIARTCLSQRTPELGYLIDDLFMSITFCKNQVASAQAFRRSDGKYQVCLELIATKFRGTPEIGEEEVPVDDYIDIGVKDASGSYQ